MTMNEALDGEQRTTLLSSSPSRASFMVMSTTPAPLTLKSSSRPLAPSNTATAGGGATLNIAR